MDQRSAYKLRAGGAIFAMAVAGGCVLFALAVAVQELVQGEYVGFGLMAFGAIICGSGLWRAKLRYDLARKDRPDSN